MKQKEKIFYSAYMYDGVVTDEDNHNFEINCYNTQLLGSIQTKRRL